MDIREAIDAVVSGLSLSLEEAAAVMRQMMGGEATSAQLASFLTADEVLDLLGVENDEFKRWAGEEPAEN